MSKDGESIFDFEGLEAVFNTEDGLVDISDTTVTKTTDKVEDDKNTSKEKTKDTDLIEVNSEGQEPEEQEKTEEQHQEPNEEPETSGELYKVFGKTLAEAGVFGEDLLEEFDGTVEGLVKVVDKEIELNINNYKESLPEVIKNLIANYEEGVPLDKLIETKSKEITYNTITDTKLEESEDLQKKVIKDYLTSTGLKEAKINKMLATFEDTGELFEEAKDALGELKELTKKQEEVLLKQTEADKKEQIKKSQELLSTIDTTIKKTEEIVPGLKLNDKIRKDIYESMTTATSRDINGNPINKVAEVRAKDPIKFEMTLHYLNTLGVFEGKWDKIIKTVKTGSVKDLEKLIKSSDGKFSTGKAKTPSAAGSTDLLNAIKDTFNK